MPTGDVVGSVSKLLNLDGVLLGTRLRKKVGAFVNIEEEFELGSEDKALDGLALSVEQLGVRLGKKVGTLVETEDEFKLGSEDSTLDGLKLGNADGIMLLVRLGSKLWTSVGTEDGALLHRSDKYSKLPMLEQVPPGKKPRSFQLARPLLVRSFGSS
mmetsp:Transcript_382/g.538  ORF Transcript_382/g.538 Transcript_382/m.538 type:complete len:157 (+) Transcript_382:216-686(+)